MYTYTYTYIYIGICYFIRCSNNIHIYICIYNYTIYNTIVDIMYYMCNIWYDFTVIIDILMYDDRFLIEVVIYVYIYIYNIYTIPYMKCVYI